MSDRALLTAGAFLRATAAGLVGVLLGVHLASVGLGPAAVSSVVGAGLAGGAIATGLATWRADRFGRRHTLIALALLTAAGGFVLAFASQRAVIFAAAFLGMVNGMGRDRGSALAIDQASLPATAPPERRTRAFAAYNVVQDVGHALGALLAALPAALGVHAGDAGGAGPDVGLLLYAALALVAAAVAACLSPAVEPTIDHRAPRTAVSDQTRRVLWRISLLFGLDGLGGGFLTTAWLSYFFHARFGADPAALGALFFFARLANTLSHVGAAWLAERIGLVRTMVFTHAPSSLLLAAAALAPSFGWAAALFLLREALVEMDVPTRQSYVMAVVREEERTLAAGLTNLVRLGAWAVAPLLAALVLDERDWLALPLLVGVALKLLYDALLWWSFRHLPAPEERLRNNLTS